MDAAPTLTVENVVRITESAYKVTFGYAIPDGTSVEQNRFVEGNTSGHPPHDLPAEQGTFTVEWQPESDAETLVWGVTLGGDESLRAATPPLRNVREEWTLTLDGLQEQFAEFAADELTLRSRDGSELILVLHGNPDDATFRLVETGLVSYESNGAWWEVDVAPEKFTPPNMVGGSMQGVEPGDRQNYYALEMSHIPYDGSQQLAHVLSEGSHWGANVLYYFPNHGRGSVGLDPDLPDEVYSRVRVRFDPDWVQETANDTCKFYWAGANQTAGNAGYGGTQPTGDDGWSVRLFSRGPDDDGTLTLGSYVYHLDQNGPYGTLWDWPDEVAIGEWNEIDTYVRLNSASDGTASADGVVRTWLNGTLQNEHTKLRFRTTEELGFDRLGPGSYWGGDEVSPRDNTIYYEDFEFTVDSDSL